MSTPSRLTVTETGRELGWMADRDLLQKLSNDGWNPQNFDFDSSGLAISFECKELGTPSTWEYDCNQEGGSSEATIGSLNSYAEFHGLEIIFVYRVGSEGAQRRGFYTRFYGRRPRADHATWSFPWQYCGVVAGVVITGSEQGKVLHPPTTHPDEWELIGTVKSWNQQDREFTGRHLRIFKRPTTQ